ncbi:MAG: hypothetical protein IKP88_08835 [Lachnospiraceae bacterium]|nr:hypothetical protein [Lachnospiraceae bacterium]
MAKAARNNTTNKEETKMAKYIVEAPEPKKGQKLSSGGIRENGKLATQFKNPVPYKEPTLPPAVVTQKPNTELIRKEQARARRNETGMYLLSLAWQEFGEPLLRSGLRKLGNSIIDKIEGPYDQPTQHIPSQDPVVIDVEADEIETVYDDDKIIRFPNRKVI